MPKRLRNLIFTFSLALISLAAGGLLAELGWRYLRNYGYGPATNLRYVVYDEILGWKYRPHTRVRHRREPFDVEVLIDDAGRRTGRSCRPERPGGPRMVFVGDSFTFGLGVEADDAFPCRLARQLDAEVFNLGVAGYGTDQEYLALEAFAPGLRPDVVVLTYCQNDLFEVLSGRRYGRPKPRFFYDGDDLRLSPARERSWWLLDRHSSLNLSLRFFVERSRRRPLTEDEEALARRIVLDLTDRMARRSVALGARFLLVMEGAGWLRERFRPATAGVRTLDVGPILKRRQKATGKKMWIPGDGHWSVAGHRVVATQIAHALREDDAKR